MKFRSLFFTALCGMAVSAAMVSCSDDSGYDPYELGSQVALPEHRGFVLNEGTYKNNDASISFFDAVNDTASSKECDLYFVQNKKQLGDTGQDIITYNGNIYVVVYGSNYIAKLNKAGFEEKRHSFFENHGQPRYVVAYEGKLYVTTVGGYIVRLDANTLTLEADCIVGKTPELLIEKDGVLYVAIGNAYDYTSSSETMAIVDTRNFNDNYVKKVNVMPNTQYVADCGNYIMVQGMGLDWINTPLWVYAIKNDKAQDTGLNATYAIRTIDDKALCLYSETYDWQNYTNHFFIYNPAEMKKEADVTSKITAEASELATNMVSGFSKGENGSFYIMTYPYGVATGTVYHFSSDYKLLGKFTSWGHRPRKVVVM